MAKELEVMEKVDHYKEMPSSEEVDSVAGELEAMIVERVKSSREYALMVAWETGKILRDNEKQFKVSLNALIDQLAEDERIRHQRMGRMKLYQCVKIYDKHPAFESLYGTEHGQNITVTKLVAMYYPPTPKKQPSVDDIARSLYNKLGPDKTEKLIKALQKILDA